MPSYGASVVLTYIAWDTSANVGKTGDVANHTLRWIKDGTAAAPTNSPSEIDATNAPGAYKLTMTTGEGTCQVGTLVGKSSTANVSIIPISVSFELLPTTYYGTAGGIPILDGNTLVGANVVRVNGTTQTARDIGASVLLSPGTGTGQLDVTSGVVKANTTQLSGTALTDIVGAIWDTQVSGHTTAGTFGQCLAPLNYGTTTATTGTSLTLNASASSDNNAYVGCWVAITDAVSGKHQVRAITAYNGSTKVATTYSWATTPSTNSNYAIFASNLSGISTSVWGASVNANTTSGTFGEWCGVGGVRVNSDGVAAVKAGVWNAYRADHATSGTFGQGISSVQGNVTGSVNSVNSLGAQAKLDVNAEVVDTLSVDTYTEPTSPPAATSSLKDKIVWLFSLGRNKITQTATNQKVRNDSDSADIGNSTTSDDGTTFTRGKFGP